MFYYHDKARHVCLPYRGGGADAPRLYEAGSMCTAMTGAPAIADPHTCQDGKCVPLPNPAGASGPVWSKEACEILGNCGPSELCGDVCRD